MMRCAICLSLLFLLSFGFFYEVYVFVSDGDGDVCGGREGEGKKGFCK